MKQYKFRPYSRTREIMATVGEIVGSTLAFGAALLLAYIFLAVA